MPPTAAPGPETDYEQLIQRLEADRASRTRIELELVKFGADAATAERLAAGEPLETGVSVDLRVENMRAAMFAVLAGVIALLLFGLKLHGGAAAALVLAVARLVRRAASGKMRRPTSQSV